MSNLISMPFHSGCGELLDQQKHVTGKREKHLDIISKSEHCGS